jgi:uncharacterized protein (DUF1015 family)
MADIRGFRGFRYDLGKVGPLSDVICPPYDVIDPELQQRLAANPFNAVRVELTPDVPGGDRYAAAAATLRDWLATDAVRQDTARSLYVLEQEFATEQGTFTRRGFLARVRLEPFGTGNVYPHEQTLSGPKADRLRLYQATGFNLSPVFGLYPDEAGEVFAKLEPLVRRQPPTVATDHLGVVNRLWAVTDSAAVSRVIGLMGPRPVFIADGHHRYETGLKYLDERRAAGDAADPEAAAHFCLMMLVGMSDPGLVILPTHRLVAELPPLTRPELEARLGPGFRVAGRFADAAGCWEHVQLEDSQRVLGFGTVADGQWLAVELTDESALAAVATDKSVAWRGLAVSLLHRLVLEKLLGGGRCTYVHRLDEVTAGVAAGGCQLACLVPPVGMGHVTAVAGNRETMPPKSTYFYPKLPTGLVFHSLKKD